MFLLSATKFRWLTFSTEYNPIQTLAGNIAVSESGLAAFHNIPAVRNSFYFCDNATFIQGNVPLYDLVVISCEFLHYCYTPLRWRWGHTPRRPLASLPSIPASTDGAFRGHIRLQWAVAAKRSRVSGEVAIRATAVNGYLINLLYTLFALTPRPLIVGSINVGLSVGAIRDVIQADLGN